MSWRTNTRNYHLSWSALSWNWSQTQSRTRYSSTFTNCLPLITSRTPSFLPYSQRLLAMTSSNLNIVRISTMHTKGTKTLSNLKEITIQQDQPSSMTQPAFSCSLLCSATNCWQHQQSLLLNRWKLGKRKYVIKRKQNKIRKRNPVVNQLRNKVKMVPLVRMMMQACH